MPLNFFIIRWYNCVDCILFVVISDLLWSDPYEADKPASSPDPDADPHARSANNNASHEKTTWFGFNETRQCSYVFGLVVLLCAIVLLCC